jgi:hypothetical protein
LSDKAPDRLKTEDGRENQLFSPLLRSLPAAKFSAKTPFSGREKDLIPNILWLQENFSKKLRKRYSQIKSTEFPRHYCVDDNLFAPVNKKINAIYFCASAEISHAVFAATF